MNRFSGRIISLMLAVIFLLSAAGVSFFLLFDGIHVDALTILDSVGAPTVLGMELVDKNGNRISTLTRYANIGTMTVTLSDPYVSPDTLSSEYRDNKKDFTFSINTDVFNINKDGTTEIKIKNNSIAKGENGGSVFQLTLTNLYFTGASDSAVRINARYPKELGFREYTAERWISDLVEVKTDDNNNYWSGGSNDDDNNSSSSKSDIAPPTPNIIISAFDYGGDITTAASRVTLDIEFKNTSQKLPIDNIVMKITMPEAFTLTSSSNTFYIEKMLKQQSEKRRIDFTVKPNAEAISHPIKISFAYECVIKEERKALTSEMEISIPVIQPNRFSITPVEIPGEIYIGDNGTSVEAKFVNMGKATVYNVSAKIVCPNLNQDGQSEFIGNMESGKQQSTDFQLEPKEPGEVKGEIVISYEDANMNISEVRTPFFSNAVAMNNGEMPPPDMQTMNPDEADPGNMKWYQKIPPWGWMVISLVAVVIFAFAAKVIRSYREKKLEAEDANF